MNNRIWWIKVWVILTTLNHIIPITAWPDFLKRQNTEGLKNLQKLPPITRSVSSTLRHQERYLNTFERIYNDIENNYVSINVMPNFVFFTKRRVMIQWRVLISKPGDWIGVYNKDPTRRLKSKPCYWYYVTGKVGYVETVIFISLVGLVGLCEPHYFLKSSVCFESMYVAYHQDNTIIATNCLKTNPTWMNELPAEIKSMELSKLFIPGTHDSGAYDTFSDPIILNTLYLKYVYTQDYSILGQLCYGARYLDLRVGYYNYSDHTYVRSVWWIYHGIIRIRPLRYILQDIKVFIEQTKEVVIIEFHKFEKGFNMLKKHNQFYKFCKSILGEHNIADNTGWKKSLKDLQDEGRRIIIIYNYLPTPEIEPPVLKPIHRYWPNAPNLRCFKKYGEYYLKSVQNHNDSKHPTLFMAEFTPRVVGVISSLSSGVRHNSKTVNPTVNNWIMMPEWGEKINFIAVDFLLSTNIVDAAIFWNHKKSDSSEEVEFVTHFADDEMDEPELEIPEPMQKILGISSKEKNENLKETTIEWNENDYQNKINELIRKEDDLAKEKETYQMTVLNLMTTKTKTEPNTAELMTKETNTTEEEIINSAITEPKTAEPMTEETNTIDSNTIQRKIINSAITEPKTAEPMTKETNTIDSKTTKREIINLAITEPKTAEWMTT
ncbi:PLC-like phosphodiesterase, TIM beta/alpha-barrel domain [Cinara cedri]|uniref:PLC-like phosphodiesterase, TIM beta/alpha-barrel domain n=1 Tax=Cinara cedri TaxID=506608 RepID=A0A5E4MCF0_9HEMI|nr:PLC-like phosphodiesterase, TIM beta/alpha-barrel domain [Cinara cedri]